MAKRCYLASPFFNDKEVLVMEKVLHVLRDEHKLEVFAPYEHQNKDIPFGSTEWREATFTGDIAGILSADVVVAIVDGNYMDSGTAFEIGFAAALDIPVVIYNAGEEVNLMIADSLTAYIDDINMLQTYNFETILALPYTDYVW